MHKCIPYNGTKILQVLGLRHFAKMEIADLWTNCLTAVSL